MSSCPKGKPGLFFSWLPQRLKRLLDIGCASSFMVATLSSKVEESYGVDLDFPKLTQARKKFPHITYLNGAGERLPFKDETFDAVTFFETLEHVDNEAVFLSEVHRVVKPGGTVLLSVPNRGFMAFFDVDNIFFRPILLFAKRFNLYTGFDDYHLKYHRNYSLQELENLFEAKFVIERVYYGGLIANRVVFIFYKSVYLFFLLVFRNRKLKLYDIMHDWMDKITTWDFDHSYGRKSDKLCLMARKI